MGQQKKTLLMTYKAFGRSIANYAAPVWNINASETNIGKIQRAQNEALRIITGSHKMSCIDHIHSGTKMLQDDEETLLQRRQRTTLSQLRYGHCKLLNSYTDLTPVELWDKPVNTIPRTELSGPGHPRLLDEDG